MVKVAVHINCNGKQNQIPNGSGADLSQDTSFPRTHQGKFRFYHILCPRVKWSYFWKGWHQQCSFCQQRKTFEFFFSVLNHPSRINLSRSFAVFPGTVALPHGETEKVLSHFQLPFLPRCLSFNPGKVSCFWL